MQQKLDICPSCGQGDFHIEGDGLTLNYDEPSKNMYLASETSLEDKLQITCTNCGTHLKATREGFRTTE